MPVPNLENLKHKIQELLFHMSVSAEVFERQEEDRVVLNLKTPDAQLLIGKQGANLEALQHIVRLLARRELPEENFPFALDIDDYRDKRSIYLKELARKAAHQVRATSRSVILAPMPSYERRTVHDYLSLYSDIASESTGMDPNRRVIIKIINKKDRPKDDFRFIENS
ncbi:MAG: KH domain-containing protein [Candidatus Doudnabacteria bacterium]|nr:KH domain-containing protein [Candidatus Doudnabacteria bacterium]